MAETAVNHESVDPKEHIPVVRVYPWNIKTTDQILRSLSLKRGKADLSLIEVNMAVKSGASVVSGGMIVPIGGKIGKGEGIIEAAYREVSEETTLHMVPYSEKWQARKSYLYISPEKYKYEIQEGDYANEERDVTVVSLPAISTKIEQALAPQQEEDKIKKIIHITINELEEGQLTGRINDGPFIESSTMLQSPKIGITRDEAKNRGIVLKNLVVFLKRTERAVNLKIKERFARKIKSPNVQMSLYDLYYSAVQSLGEKHADVFMRTAVDEIRTEIYVDYFREKEDEELGDQIGPLKSGERAAREWQALGILAQSLKAGVFPGIPPEKHDKYLQFAESRARSDAEIIRIGLNKGNHGQDILHLLTLITQTESSGARTTKTALAIQDLLFHAFTVSAIKNGQSPEAVFQRILSRNPSFGETTTMLDQMDDNFIQFVAQSFGESETYVREVLMATANFIPNFGELVKVNDPSLSYLYQAHSERNEVSSAQLPKLCAFAFYHPDLQVRFEAGRKLLIFFKGLLAKKEYDRKVAEGSRFFDEAIDVFFGRAVKRYEFKHEGMSQVLLVRSNKYNGARFYVIVDKKPVKTLESSLRKSFEKNPEDINDIFSYSIVFDPHETMGERTYQERIDFAEAVTNGFLQTLFQQEGYDVEIYEDDGKERYENLLKATKNGAIKTSREGERTGSKGNWIARRQIYLRAKRTSGGQVSNVEIAIYPLIKINDENIRKQRFMGWEEKHADDRAYGLRRAVSPMTGTPGLGSLHERLLPTAIYKELLVVQAKKITKSHKP